MKGNANERGAAFMAIGKLAQAVGSAIAPQLGSIVAQIEGEYSSVCSALFTVTYMLCESCSQFDT